MTMTIIQTATTTAPWTRTPHTTERATPAGRIAGKTYEARLAVTDAVREQAYRVRYRSYLAQGFIDSNPSGLFHDAFDERSNARTVVIYDQGHPLASVRACLLARGSTLRSPAVDTFPDEVGSLLSRNPSDAFAGRAVEFNRLVRAPEAANNQGLVFLLYRMAGYIALCYHAQLSLACVRASHKPFYGRLGFETFSEPRLYPGLSCDMQLMACSRADYDASRAATPILDPYGSTTGDLKGFFAGEAIQLKVVE